MLALSILGAVDVRGDDGPVRIPAGKATELLVRLAVDAGTVVRSERIIEDLWGAAAADTVRNTLQSKVSMLRRSLGDPTLVKATSDGYLLDVPRGCVDALAAADLGGRAHTLLAAGDAAAALGESEAGPALFRGEILSDAGAGDWLVPHSAQRHSEDSEHHPGDGEPVPFPTARARCRGCAARVDRGGRTFRRLHFPPDAGNATGSATLFNAPYDWWRLTEQTTSSQQS